MQQTAEQYPVLITPLELRQMLKCSHAALYSRIRKGLIPKPFKIGTASRWRLEDIKAYIDQMAETKSS